MLSYLDLHDKFLKVLVLACLFVRAGGTDGRADGRGMGGAGVGAAGGRGRERGMLINIIKIVDQH